MTDDPVMPQATVDAAFLRIVPDGPAVPTMRALAVEMPVAVEVNGLGYAVMMATPTALEDFAYGFCLSERLIDDAADVLDVVAHPAPQGMVLRITLVPERVERVLERVRHRVSESSCGLCGIENLEQALRVLPMVAPGAPVTDAAVFRALGSLRALQPLNRMTGAVHAAACCTADGEIRAVREDIGRHNAFDKLLGAMARGGLEWDGGFALLSARCSYELVEKAALAKCPMLVTISAPTSLAVTRAAGAGVRLVALARADAVLAAV
ncbi:formate dehydrogenase accessory sulfurtransferase FdhD [Sphingomonas arantia]|uniref:Sulfur carrier protein FdhD n=1 Tax=Sphingomonas arantia TaxID=1460676 RepID=A0ABW4TW80_9SPHN